MNNKERLPVFQIFLQTLSLTQRNVKTLVRFNLPWLFASLLWLTFSQLTASGEVSFDGQEWLSMVLIVVLLGATVMAAVSSHRVYLMGEAGVMGLKPLRWTDRESSFCGWFILVGFFGCIILIPFLLTGFFLAPVLGQYLAPLGASGWIAVILPVIVLMVYFWARWSLLLLPAVALGEREGSFRWPGSFPKGMAGV